MKPELLLPGGNVEKIDYAIKYGADAVYFGLEDYSLRQMRKGEIITIENLKEVLELIHKNQKKGYVTLNIFAFDDDIKKLEADIEKIASCQPDAFIISDFGILNTVKKYTKNIDIHISTQTNTLNSEACKFYRDLGASRVILARELSLKQIETIRKNVPDVELEMFIHGAQCMSFSGRCLLSDFMTKGERRANHGECAQPCRWSYKLLEETRPNEYYEIVQDNRGSHILSTKDLALIDYIQNIIDMNIDSLKIEGRTKSLYYVSAIARAYRCQIDRCLNKNKIELNQNLKEELAKIGNRGYTTGFVVPEDESANGYSYDISKGLAGADFLFEILEIKDNQILVKIKNKVNLNQQLELILPDKNIIVEVVKIINSKNEITNVANTNDEVWFEFDKTINDKNLKYALGRTIGVKNVC